MKFDVKKVEETMSLYVFRQNRFGMDHDCDGQMDRPTERPLAIARINIRVWCALTKWVNSTVAIAV